MHTTLLLDMAADTWPERAAVSCARHTLSYAELRRLAATLARRVRAAGARSVAYLGVNDPIAAVALYAAGQAGVPYAPLNYRLTRRELEALVTRLDAPLLVAAPRLVAGLRLPKGVVRADGEAVLRGEPVAAACEPVAAIDPDAVAVQLFTSGTSGAPKAALLRHAHLTAYLLATVEFGAAAAEEAALVCVPPYHIAGIAALLSSTYAARRAVLLPEFDAAAWLALAVAERVTHAFVVPTMLSRIVDELARAGASAPPALRAIAYGGGSMPVAVIERAMRLLPTVAFTNAYGLTETSSTICLLEPEDHRAAAESFDPAVRARLGSVGRPLPSVEIEVRDESGRPVGSGEPGHIFVRGAQVAGEYRDTGPLLDADGWFATRDRGWIDAAGYLFLDGRADDVIVRGGENISPGEIEAVLREHPAVADAAVLAVASEEWGEAVAAVVILDRACDASERELQEWARARLRSSRVPERIVFRDRLPYNEMGKLVRRELKREFGGQA